MSEETCTAYGTFGSPWATNTKPSGCTPTMESRPETTFSIIGSLSIADAELEIRTEYLPASPALTHGISSLGAVELWTTTPSCCHSYFSCAAPIATTASAAADPM